MCSTSRRDDSPVALPVVGRVVTDWTLLHAIVDNAITDLLLRTQNRP